MNQDCEDVNGYEMSHENDSIREANDTEIYSHYLNAFILLQKAFHSIKTTMQSLDETDDQRRKITKTPMKRISLPLLSHEHTLCSRGKRICLMVLHWTKNT